MELNTFSDLVNISFQLFPSRVWNSAYMRPRKIFNCHTTEIFTSGTVQPTPLVQCDQYHLVPYDFHVSYYTTTARMQPQPRQDTLLEQYQVISRAYYQSVIARALIQTSLNHSFCTRLKGETCQLRCVKWYLSQGHNFSMQHYLYTTFDTCKSPLHQTTFILLTDLSEQLLKQYLNLELEGWGKCHLIHPFLPECLQILHKIRNLSYVLLRASPDRAIKRDLDISKTIAVKIPRVPVDIEFGEIFVGRIHCMVSRRNSKTFGRRF